MIRSEEKSTTEIYSKAFFETFVLGLVLSWLPAKSLGYVVPFICLGWFIFRANSGKTLLKTLFILYFFLALSLLYALVYNFLYSDEKVNILGNSVISIVTYSSFLIIAAIPGKLEFSKYDYTYYVKIIKGVILFESFVGFFQLFIVILLKGKGFDLGAGDVVQGTIGLLAFRGGNAGFGNQMFSINMVFCLLFITPYVIVNKKHRMTLFIGFMALMFSSVLHVFIALLGSLVFIAFIFRRKIITGISKPFIAVIILIFGGVIGLAFFQPRNFTNIAQFALLYAEAKSPKIAAANTAIFDLPRKYPTALVVGLGPGQFSSKAGLIGSGLYFGGFDNPQKLPFLPNDMTEAFKDYFLEIWKEYTTNNAAYGSSTMHRPFFSILSILMEFGIINLLFLLILMGYFLTVLRRVFLRERFTHRINSYLGFSCAAGIVFLLGIGAFENYLETSQAIMPGLLMLKMIYCMVAQSSHKTILELKKDRKALAY